MTFLEELVKKNSLPSYSIIEMLNGHPAIPNYSEETMIVYMLRRGDLWYRRRGGRSDSIWVDQQRAAVWTTKQGASSAKGSIPRAERPDCVIEKFALETR